MSTDLLSDKTFAKFNIENKQISCKRLEGYKVLHATKTTQIKKDFSDI